MDWMLILMFVVLLGVLALGFAVLWVAAANGTGSVREAVRIMTYGGRERLAMWLVKVATVIGNGRRGWHAEWGEPKARPVVFFGYGPRTVMMDIPDGFGKRCEREAVRSAMSAGEIRGDLGP